MRKKDRINSEVFIFDADEVYMNMQDELKIFNRLERSFDYVYDKLVKLKNHIEISDLKKFDLNKVKLNEGKNYNWLSVKYNNTCLIVRQYHTHLTVYTKFAKISKHDSSWVTNTYGMFTFNTNTDGMDGNKHDSYCDNPFIEFNKIIPQLIEILQERHLGSIWNNLILKRPCYCEIKLGYDNESIYSVDQVIFGCEELSNLHFELFAQNEMLEKLKNIKHRVGEEFDHNTIIKEIRTEFPEQYLDPYYHGVGIITIDKDDKTKFEDVYSLTRWHFDKVFKE